MIFGSNSVSSKILGTGVPKKALRSTVWSTDPCRLNMRTAVFTVWMTRVELAAALTWGGTEKNASCGVKPPASKILIPRNDVVTLADALAIVAAEGPPGRARDWSGGWAERSASPPPPVPLRASTGPNGPSSGTRSRGALLIAAAACGATLAVLGTTVTGFKVCWEMGRRSVDWASADPATRVSPATNTSDRTPFIWPPAQAALSWSMELVSEDFHDGPVGPLRAGLLSRSGGDKKRRAPRASIARSPAAGQ